MGQYQKNYFQSKLKMKTDIIETLVHAVPVRDDLVDGVEDKKGRSRSNSIESSSVSSGDGSTKPVRRKSKKRKQSRKKEKENVDTQERSATKSR